MRRNFAQCLREVELSPLKEYQKLYDMLFEPTFQQEDGSQTSMHDEFDEHFKFMWFRGTCFSLDEFDEQNGFTFLREPADFSMNHLCSISEYIWNLLMGYESAMCSEGQGYGIFATRRIDVDFCLIHIRDLVENLGYEIADDDDFTIIVPKNAAATAVANSDIIPGELSKKIIGYNHYSMSGDIQEKKNTILRLADLLEPKRKDLDRVDKELSNDLFYLFNNLNLRHNNIDPSAKKNYKKAVAELPPEELEHWYDETYQMCLLAFMRLEHAERKIEFEKLKNQIETN